MSHRTSISWRFEKDATTRIGGGMEGWKPYVVLNRDEQAMVIGGGAAAVRAAMCAIPVVGTAACIVAGALLGRQLVMCTTTGAPEIFA